MCWVLLFYWDEELFLVCCSMCDTNCYLRLGSPAMSYCNTRLIVWSLASGVNYRLPLSALLWLSALGLCCVLFIWLDYLAEVVWVCTTMGGLWFLVSPWFCAAIITVGGYSFWSLLRTITPACAKLICCYYCFLFPFFAFYGGDALLSREWKRRVFC